VAAHDGPTHRQLDYIKQLACSRGVSFIPPANRVQASRLIDQLKRRDRSPSFEVAADREQTSALHGEHAPASSPHQDEISGYGSHAHWRNTRPPRRH
jgi:transketolase